MTKANAIKAAAQNVKGIDFGLGDLVDSLGSLKALREKMELLRDVPLSKSDGLSLLLAAVVLADREKPNNDFRKNRNWKFDVVSLLDEDYRKSVTGVIRRMQYQDLVDAIREAVKITRKAGIKQYIFGLIQVGQKDYELYNVYMLNAAFKISTTMFKNPDVWQPPNNEVQDAYAQVLDNSNER